MKATFLGETDRFDAHAFGDFEIAFRRKTTVKGSFERITAINFILSIQNLFYQIGIRGVAVFNRTIGNEVGATTGEAHLVIVKCVPPIFDNDVRMRFKDGHNFIRSMYCQTMKHSFFGLGILNIQHTTFSPTRMILKMNT